jgi:thiol:disulfide interchange protein DsbD
VALFLFGYFYVLEKELRWRSPELVVAESRPGTGRGGAIEWKQWSQEAVDSARNEGHPVLVDFTANWCLVCKLNKKRAIEIQPVQEKLKKIGAVALRGDHTKEDPRITEELRRYDRAGVPLVLVFPADRSKPAIVLPEILNPKTVLDALEEASQAHLASGNAPVRGN